MAMPVGFDFIAQNQFFVQPSDFDAREWQTDCLLQFERLASFAPSPRTAPSVFTVYAGVGSGKTKLAALIASHALNTGVARMVVYVAPNRAIAHAVRKAFKCFGIDLAPWKSRKARDIEGSAVHGYIMTYQAMANRPHLHRLLAKRNDVLVFFDEVHHLSDSQKWGEAAEEAFSPAAFVVGLTGTPFRSDGAEIPFVTYATGADGLKRIVAKPPHGYTYPLGRAISDGYCREPMFTWLTGDVEITPPDGDGPTHVVNFASDISPESANLRLAGAVKYGSQARIDALRIALTDCRIIPSDTPSSKPKRKLLIIVGGDPSSDNSAKDDASFLLPREIASLGVDEKKIVWVTSDDSDAVHKIAAFGESDAEILIAINMVSEGVDIPQLSALLLLTNITAVNTTVQRIGRVLRKLNREDPIIDALIFIFADKRYVDFSKEMKREIRYYEIRARAARESTGNEAERQPRKATSIGLNARLDGVTFNGKVYTQDQVDIAGADIARRGMAVTTFSLGYALEILFGDAQSRKEAV